MDSRQQPVALVGMACRFPGEADSLARFWQMLCHGQDAIGDIPADRWEADRFYHPDKNVAGKMYVRQGGFVRQDLSAMDYDFFAVSAREAAAMDPQQRLLLEVTYEALCDAGIPLSQLRGEAVGTFIGGFTLDRTVIQLRESNRQLINAHSAAGMTMTILSARLAHWLDLSGPCLTLDTACSSSLVALHLAAQSLASGECHTALVGGVNAMLIPDYGIAMCKGQFLSADGRCKAFAAGADGYGRAEGAGLVVLKTLARAQADGDRIYATLLGSGTNHNGHTTGIAQPDAMAQQALMRQVHRRAGIDAADIDYVETHGTGTQAGDRAESEALGLVIGQARRARGQSLLVGAVKSSIGHLEAAAGIAGVIKTALVLHHQQVPANLHGQQPNPAIPFDALGLTLVNDPLHEVTLDLAAVNSFGYGGSNAHAIFARHIAPPDAAAADRAEYRFPISAQSPAALRAMAADYARFIRASPASLAVLCDSASQHLSHLAYRELAIVTDKAQLVEQLSLLAAEGAVDRQPVAAQQPDGVVMVFSGMGSGYRGMAQELWQQEADFRAAFTRCEIAFRQLQPGGASPGDVLWGSGTERASDAELQVAIVATQIALVTLWRAKGITPVAVIGHSTGEMAAAWAAGIISLEEALWLAVERSRLQQQVEGQGRLLAVEADEVQFAQLLAACSGRVELAAVNTPDARVLAGDAASLAEIVVLQRQAGRFCSFASVNTPYHSRYLDDLRTPALASFQRISPQAGQIPFFSTVRGECIAGERLTADYWWDNMRNPVLFDPALRQLLQAGHKLLLEVGGHPVLSPYLKKTAAETGARCFSSQHRKQPQQHYLRQNLAALYRAGAAIRWPADTPGSLRVSFPAYPWQRLVASNESPRSFDDRLRGSQRPLLGSRIDAPDPSWQQELDQRFGWLQDHQVMSRTVFPAAGYIEAALQASAELQQHHSAILENISFRRICVLAAEGPTVLRVQVQPGENRFTLYSSEPSAAPQWIAHADGQMLSIPRMLRRDTVDIAALRQQCRQPFSGDLHTRFSALGLEYGPAFSLISAIHKADNALLVDIQPADSLLMDGYLIHPTLLDASFQSLLALLPAGQQPDRAFLPVFVRRVLLYAPASTPLQAYVRCSYRDGQSIEGDITLFDRNGQICLEITGLKCEAVTLARPDRLAGKLWHWQWLPAAVAVQPTASVTVIGGQPEANCPGSRCIDFWQAADSLTVARSPLIVCPPRLEGDPQAREQLAAALLQFSRLAREIARQQPTLAVVLVTRNALSLPQQQAEVDLCQAAFWGMARTLLSELPQLNMRLLDCDCDLPLAIDACASVLSLPPRGEYGLRDGTLLRHVFTALSSAELQRPPQQVFDDNGGQRILLQSFTAADPAVSPFSLTPRQAPAADEVEIAVLAAALRPQGGCHEVSGTILRAGNQSGFIAGQRVIALADHPLCASHLTLRLTPGYHNSAVIMLPASDSPLLHDPCLLPVITAIACLRQRLRLLAGEVLLIIGDLPGEVQAAIDLARADGASVLVVSHAAAHLHAFRQQGASAVFDSRDPLWLRAVQAWVGETAIAVILNFSPTIGEERLLPLLDDFGTLIDLYPGNREIATRPAAAAKTNLTRLSVDCLAMLKTRPVHFSQLAQQAIDTLQTGEVQRVPPLAFAADRIHFALTHTRENKSALRSVLQFAGNSIVARRSFSPARASAQASYLITGGVRGLGFHLAGWLVAKGAKELILVGRSGVLPEVQRAQVQQWQADGVSVHVMACDISDGPAVTALMARIALECLPLKGIIHCAAQVQDALSDRLSLAQLQQNLAAKVMGAWHLHQASAALPLDWFMLSSSVSSVFGNPGQAGYAAANTALEALGQLRRQQKKPTVTINWGAIEGAGMVADRPELAAHFRLAGIGLLPLTLIDSLMDQVLNGESHQLTLADITWPALAGFIGICDGGSPFEGVIAAQATEPHQGGQYIQRLSALPVAQRSDYVAEQLMQLLRQVVGGSEQALSLSQSTSQFGLDSLMYLEFQVQIKRAFQVNIPASELLTGASLRELAETVIGRMGLTLQANPAVTG